ncbi:MAG: hypothetical protein WAW37_11860 [Syntrophobacteraceae bacterium]
MESRNSYGQPAEIDHSEAFFRLINPEEYPLFGINAEDVPIGTFAAEDHPGFLPSRFGGNAYGLGLMEQGVLTRADTDFLDSIDFENPKELQKNSRKLNAVYQKLGLLIRFSATGKRYFLIPINLVAHSFQEIKTKADEIEALIKRHISETHSERVDIGLVTSPEDLIVHELTARFSNQRIHIFDSLDKLRTWRIPLDIIVLPRDPLRFLREQRFPRKSGRQLRKKDLIDLAAYLAAKLFDLLEEDGRLHILAHSPAPREDQVCRVRFKSDDELKCFLLFSHTFKTQGGYRAPAPGSEMEIHVSDLHYYLNRFAFSEPHLKRLLDRQRPEDLSLEAIDGLPHLNISLGDKRKKEPEREWRKVFEPFFDIESLEKKSSRAREEYWHERLDIDRPLPEGLLAMVAARRRPSVTLAALEDEIRQSGMQGCALPLVAEYRKNFKFVLDVLNVLARIRDRAVGELSELGLNRLANPFRGGSGNFHVIVQLLAQAPKLEKIRRVLNPNQSEGQDISIVENLEKLSLLGFTPAQLREILLIVVGHTTMTRIVFGKIPARSLKPITERAREEDQEEIFDLLRICRLMSMAEIIAAVGDAFLVHSVLASAAVKEGAMVSDLLDCFIQYRAVALEVIRSGNTWENYLKEVLEEKGRAVLSEFQFQSREGKLLHVEQVGYCGIGDAHAQNERLWQGRQSAALERLLKLSGSLWVEYEDIQMYLREIPINFIYHKKKLKSVGPAAFEKQLLRGVEMLYLVSSLSPEVRYYLLYCLDHLGGAMRIYDFQRLPDHFGLSESLKLLIISLQAFHHHFGVARKGGLVSFTNIAREPGSRREVLGNILRGMPFPAQCFEGRKIMFTPDRFGELRFEASARQRAINVVYRDTVRFDSMLQSLRDIWDNDSLRETCEQWAEQLRNRMPAGAEELEQDLRKAFRAQQKKINERVVKTFQEKLGHAESIPQFQKVRREIESTKSQFAFIEEQLFLLEEMSEFNRFRIRDASLDAIYREISGLKTRESLRAYWDNIKYDLFLYRSFIGKEYETLIAKFIDEKMERLEGWESGAPDTGAQSSGRG